MIDAPFLRRVVRRVKRAPLTATAACLALGMLTFGTVGCGGAGTPGLSSASNRSNDLSDLTRDAANKNATIATGRMGVFLTATTFETAPPAAQDAVPTSADLPSGENPDTKSDAKATKETKETKGETPAALPADPTTAPDKTIPATAPDAKPTAPAAPKPDTGTAASALLSGDDTPPTVPGTGARPAPVVNLAAPKEDAKADAKTSQAAKPAAKGETPTVVNDAPPAATRAKTTDAANTYSHIWATILKIELLDSGDNKAVTVWEDQNGMTLDLQTLHDKNGRRFALVTSAAVPSGRSYERVRVTLGNGFELFTPGSTTGTVAPLSDTLARDSEGRPIVSFGLARPRDLASGKDNLFVDFDLRKLQIDSGRVLPVVRESGTRTELAEGEGVPSQQNAQSFAGIVTEWTPGKKAGEAAFTLALPGGQTVTVQTTSATGVWNDDGKPSPMLANNKRVRIAGRLSTQNNRVLAEEVAVYPAASGDAALAAATAVAGGPPQTNGGTPGLQAAVERTGAGVSTAPIALASEIAQATQALAATPLPIPPAQVTGVIGQPDETGGTFNVGVRQVGGIIPTQGVVSVQVVPDAVYRGAGGMTLDRTAFFAEAAKAGRGTFVRAEGEYETATGALKASRLILVPAAPSALPATHSVVVQGVPAKASVKNGTLQVANLTEWENIAASDGKNPVHIVLTASTELRNENKEFIARENFFKTIESPDEKNGLNVRVQGTYANGVLTATHIELRPAPSKTDDAMPPTVAKKGGKGDATAAAESAAKKADENGDEPEIPAPSSKKTDKADKTAPTAPTAPVPPVEVPAVPVAPAPAPALPVVPTPPAAAPAKTAP